MHFLLGALMAISSMSVEEKVGQVLMVHVLGEGVSEETVALVEKTHLGGVIYYNWANGLTSPQQVQGLSVGLQKISKIPLFIAVDQEGGAVQRLEKGFTYFYGNVALGIADDPNLAEEAGFAMGEELRAVGVNLNLAPVVDVSAPEQDPRDAARRLGSSPKTVSLLAGKMLQGFHQAGILGTLKHFPGHGTVSIDSHLDIARLDKPFGEIVTCDLYPFATLLQDTDMIMTGHILVPELDPEKPATLSSTVLEGLLRQGMGYEGVIVSDSLIMEGVLKCAGSVEEATLQAFEAGCDILLLGGKQLHESQEGFELTADDIVRIHKMLVEAVQSGRISMARLDASVARILTLKARINVTSLSEEDITRCVGTKEHQDLANRIFDRSLRCAKPLQSINSD